MRKSQSDYSFEIKNGVLIIQDLDLGRKSVTNDMLNVLIEIKSQVGNRINDLDVIYRDSEGVWDGVKAEWTVGGCAEVDFYPIGENKLETAIKKIKR